MSADSDATLAVGETFEWKPGKSAHLFSVLMLNSQVCH